MEADDDAVSEITILPDGRVFVLGASRQVLEILETLSPEDAALKQRLKYAGGVANYESVERGDEMKISGRSTNAVSEGRHP
jgi:hypothetical protein